jgi:hypothetical protein
VKVAGTPEIEFKPAERWFREREKLSWIVIFARGCLWKEKSTQHETVGQALYGDSGDALN